MLIFSQEEHTCPNATRKTDLETWENSLSDDINFDVQKFRLTKKFRTSLFFAKSYDFDVLQTDLELIFLIPDFACPHEMMNAYSIRES